MRDTRIDTALLVIAIVVIVLAAGIAGTELQRLRLENEHLAAELAIKTEALTHANSRLMEMEAQ